MMRLLPYAFVIAVLLASAVRTSATDAGAGLAETAVADLPIKLVYDPALVRSHAINPSEQNEVDEANAAGVVTTYVLEAKFRSRSEKYFVVVCSSGGSDDFSCMFRPVEKSNDGPFQNQIEGVRFEIPGDDCVYVSGHVNTTFDHRRKYCLDGDRLKEIGQPFHYVGLKTKTLHELTFYFDKAEASAIVGTIGKGEFVEVLIASSKEDDGRLSYLVRDKNGLTGWVTLSIGQEAQDIEGLFFKGD